MYICAKRGASGAVAADLASGFDDAIEIAMIVSHAAAARAVATFGVGMRECVGAVGATSTGVATGMPSTVVAVSTRPTSCSTCGRSAYTSHDAAFAISVSLPPAPRAM